MADQTHQNTTRTAHLSASRFSRTAEGKASIAQPHATSSQRQNNQAAQRVHAHSAARRTQAPRTATPRINTRVQAGNSPIRIPAGKRRRHRNAAGTLIAIALFVVAGFTAFWLWSHRAIAITVNGREIDVHLGSSLEDILSQTSVQYTPGDFVSVGGKVLEAGAGHTFSASVDGTELTEEERHDFRLKGPVDLVLGDGADKVEDYDFVVEEEQPSFIYEGQWAPITYVSQWGQVGKTEIRTGKISGETAPGDVLQERKDCIVSSKYITPDNDQKLVAITFDDGPSEYTERYIEILNRYGAHATFFCLGASIDAHPDIAKAITDSGNQICSHTYNHYNLPLQTGDTLRSELTSAFSALKNATGLDTTIIRPPYGEFNSYTWQESDGLISVSVLWTQDSEDWKLPGVDAIVANSLVNIGSGSIILMHDGGGNRDQDLEALPRVLEALKADGYSIVTINELLASDSSLPKELSSGNAQMPTEGIWPTQTPEA